MQLHQLQVSAKRKKKRVGRGGKRGTYSGRGIKGQKSRSGRRIRPAFRDLLIRIPKRRGFRNRPLSPKPLVINLRELNALALRLAANPAPGTINPEVLRGLGRVPMGYRGAIKVLGAGEISAPVIIRNLLVSASAKKKIEQAGGKVLE